MSQFQNPVAVYGGHRGCEELAAALAVEYSHVGKVLLLTRGESVEQEESLRPLLVWAQQRELRLKELSLSNPDLDDILSLKQELGSFDYQLIVAIGGGSVMDMAKSLAAIQKCDLSTTAELRTCVTAGSYESGSKATPWIGIPTTAGTGSEVTKWATVWDRELSCKYSISGDTLYGRKALIVAELMRSMPLRLSATTALDAMCHATEAYWSVHTNAITRLYALAAIERVRTALPQLHADPQNLETRELLANASLYAGLAFSNTRTTACHSISYPLTLLHGIDHGIAASMTLGAVARINESALVEPENLYRAFGVARVEEINTVVRRLYDLFGIPQQLRAYGVTEESITQIAAGAFTKGRMDNNPVEISEAMVREMLRNAL